MIDFPHATNSQRFHDFTLFQTHHPPIGWSHVGSDGIAPTCRVSGGSGAKPMGGNRRPPNFSSLSKHAPSSAPLDDRHVPLPHSRLADLGTFHGTTTARLLLAWYDHPLLFYFFCCFFFLHYLKINYLKNYHFLYIQKHKMLSFLDIIYLSM